MKLLVGAFAVLAVIAIFGTAIFALAQIFQEMSSLLILNFVASMDLNQ
jgi:hypothetical protein